MHALLLCLATAAVGINAGWHRTPDGGMEYIIQLDPQNLESLGDGRALQSDVHPEAGVVHSFQIIVGKQPLPRETPPNQPDLQKPPPTPPTPERLPTGTAGKSIPGRTVSHEESDKAATEPSPSEPSSEALPPEPAKPWLPLTFTLLALFASFGLNLFLGWIAWDSRKRVRADSEAV